MTIEKFTSSKFFIILLILILIGIFTALGKEGYRKYQLDKEITSLEKEISSLKKENKEISELLNYFKSNEFLEKQARLKLNLLKQGEKLIIIRPEKQDILSSSSVEESKTKKDFSNIKRWWDYLFNH